MGLKATIDPDRCQGHGRCAMIAPEVFDVDDAGLGEVLVDPVPVVATGKVHEAVLSCPELAISVE